MNPIDTLKQAAQALRDTMPELAAALEAMANVEPVGWRPKYGHGIESDFSKGLPPKETIDYWKVRGIDIEYAYAAPIATPEHDAKVRDAALEEAAMALDNERAIYPGNSITRVYNRAIDDGLEAIRALKTNGGDHDN